jgi:hypothetical protein
MLKFPQAISHVCVELRTNISQVLVSVSINPDDGDRYLKCSFLVQH